MSERELPEGWCEATLGDLAHINMGQSPDGDATNNEGRGLPLVGGAANLRDGRVVVDRYTDAPTKVSEPGDLIFCVRATIGKLAVGEARYCLGRGVAGLRPRCGIDPNYVRHYLAHSTDALAEQGTGSTFVQIDRQTLADFAVPVPPASEQARIVACLDALQARSRAAREALAEVPALLDQLRQSVLAAAFRGDLTAAWREANPVGGDGASLLQHARAGHREWWVRGGKKKKWEPAKPVPVEDEALPGIPDSWAWAGSAEIVEPGTIITYGVVLPGPHVPDGVPYVRGGDIENGVIQTGQLLRMAPEIAAGKDDSALIEGDVLLCIIRHLKVAVVPPGLDGANVTQGTVRLRASQQVDNQYLARYLASPDAQGWMKGRYFGLAMPRINVADAREIPIPLPPLEEQREIVRRLVRLEQQLAGTAEVAGSYTSDLTTLDQSILARAFDGELVEQDPNDQPAEALLARLRADHAASGKPGTRRGRG